MDIKFLKYNNKNYFQDSFDNLKDRKLKIIIHQRFQKIVENGHLGKINFISDSIFELKFKIGSGYRIYYIQDGKEIIIILCSGNKSSQKRDILKAKQILKFYRIGEKLTFDSF